MISKILNLKNRCKCGSTIGYVVKVEEVVHCSFVCCFYCLKHQKWLDKETFKRVNDRFITKEQYEIIRDRQKVIDVHNKLDVPLRSVSVKRVSENDYKKEDNGVSD